jgi:hypothetical protein
MEQLFQNNGLQSTRISATNGAESFVHLLDGNMPSRLRPAEIATSISHLRAIKEWFDNSDEEFAFFVHLWKHRKQRYDYNLEQFYLLFH